MPLKSKCCFVSMRNYLADPPFSRSYSICQTSLLLRIPKAVSFVTQSGCYISAQQLDIGEHSVPSLVFTFGGMRPQFFTDAFVTMISFALIWTTGI